MKAFEVEFTEDDLVTYEDVVLLVKTCCRYMSNLLTKIKTVSNNECENGLNLLEGEHKGCN